MLTAAVVGCGGIGAAHMRALGGLPGVTLGFVVDPQPGLAAARAAEYGATPLGDWQRLPPDVAVVVVATPPATHYGLVRDLLAAGHHVFCEKPLTVNVAAAVDLRECAVLAGRQLGVGFKMRYEPWFQLARSLIHEIGPVRQVVSTKQQSRHDKPWLPQTGAMQELSSHDFDLLHWIAGLRPHTMLAAHLAHRYGWPAEDAFALTVSYDTGAVGSLNGLYTDAIAWTGRDQTLRFHGDRGYLHVDRGERVVVHTDQLVVHPCPPAGDMFAAELADFVAAVQGDPEVRYPTVEAAIASTWVVEQALRLAGEPERRQPGFDEDAR